MALVLCTGIDKALLYTRRLILEGAGHTVFVILDENTLLAVCHRHSIDVAVIGEMISGKVKRHITALVREHCPKAKILELYPAYSEKELDNADSSLMVPSDAPGELADHVNELAGTEKSKSTHA
jgi:hypothetical protein